MSSEQKPSKSPIPGIIIGVIFMVAGTYVSVNITKGPLEALAKQGILLDPGKTLGVVGVFLVLFPAIKVFYLNPLTEAINRRNSDIERTFSEAEDLRTQMTAMKSDYEQRLARTEAEAREQIQNQIKEAQSLRGQLMQEAASKADELVKKAQEEIENEKTRVMFEIRSAVVNLTLTATERVLGENMTDDRNRKLVEEFINTVEVPS